MEEDPDVRGGGRAAENKRITRYPDLADDRSTGAAEPASHSSQQPPIQDKVPGSKHEIKGPHVRCDKFRHCYEGPFTITELVTPVTVWLELPSAWQMHDAFHV